MELFVELFQFFVGFFAFIAGIVIQSFRSFSARKLSFSGYLAVFIGLFLMIAAVYFGPLTLRFR